MVTKGEGTQQGTSKDLQVPGREKVSVIICWVQRLWTHPAKGKPSIPSPLLSPPIYSLAPLWSQTACHNPQRTYTGRKLRSEGSHPLLHCWFLAQRSLKLENASLSFDCYIGIDYLLKQNFLQLMTGGHFFISDLKILGSEQIFILGTGVYSHCIKDTKVVFFFF